MGEKVVRKGREGVKWKGRQAANFNIAQIAYNQRDTLVFIPRIHLINC